jgi:phosphoglycolate phosphatase-like HAD superfamily hydrolase
LKLASVGLAEHFRVGGYGSDHEVRDHLPGFAVARAVDAWGVTFSEQSVVVIGDTPRDVQCGKHHGTRTVAVATGRFDGGQLEQTGADAVFEDFSDVDHVLEVLLQ